MRFYANLAINQHRLLAVSFLCRTILLFQLIADIVVDLPSRAKDTARSKQLALLHPHKPVRAMSFIRSVLSSLLVLVKV